MNTHRRSEHQHHRRHLVRIGLGIVTFALVFHFFVLPLFADFDKTWATLRQLNPWLGLIAVGFELTVWWLYGQTFRLLLPKRFRPSAGVCFGTSVASKGVSHVIPAGGVGTVAIDYRLMTQAGVPNGQLVYAFGAAGAMSGVVLNVLLALSLIVAIPQSGASSSYGVGVAVGCVTIGAIAVAIWAILERTDSTARLAGRAVGWIPGVHAQRIQHWVRRVAENLRSLGADRPRLGQLILISIGKWTIGALAAWVVFAALGHHTNIFAVFVAFALATVVSVLPVSPGGLGIFETTMIATLAAFGTPHTVATAGVLAFRMINFWLPIPLGAAAYIWVERSTQSGHGVAPAVQN